MQDRQFAEVVTHWIGAYASLACTDEIGSQSSWGTHAGGMMQAAAVAPLMNSSPCRHYSQSYVVFEICVAGAPVDHGRVMS